MSKTPLTDYVQMRLNSPHKIDDECNFLLFIISQVEQEYAKRGDSKGCAISFNRKAVDLRMSVHQAHCLLPTLLSEKVLPKYVHIVAQSLWIFMDITAKEALKMPWVIANSMLDQLQGLVKQIAGTMVLFFDDAHEKNNDPNSSGAIIEALRRADRTIEELYKKCNTTNAVVGTTESLEYFKEKQAKRSALLESKGAKTVEELEKWLNKDN